MKELIKIKHIPSGYFIQPSTSSKRNSNLGKKGKIYEGVNIWTRIQNGNEYTMITVYEGYGIYEDLASRFPDLVENGRYNRPRVTFYAKPEDFEKIVVGTID